MLGPISVKVTMGIFSNFNFEMIRNNKRNNFTIIQFYGSCVISVKSISSKVFKHKFDSNLFWNTERNSFLGRVDCMVLQFHVSAELLLLEKVFEIYKKLPMGEAFLKKWAKNVHLKWS